MAKKNQNTLSDFQKDQPADHTAKVSMEEVKQMTSLKNERTQKIAGFLILVFTLILFISFISFFFSWKTDQDFLASHDYERFKEHNGEVSNAMGLLGARLGFLFVHKGFGISSFLLLPVLALTGLRLLFNYRRYSLLRLSIHTLLITIWLSLFLGWLLGKVFEVAPLMGGSFGFFGAQKLSNTLGTFGAFLFLLVYAVVYSIVFFNLNPFDKIKIPKKDKDTGLQPWVEDSTQSSKEQKVGGNSDTGANIIVDEEQKEIDQYLNSNKTEEDYEYEPEEIIPVKSTITEIKKEPPVVKEKEEIKTQPEITPVKPAETKQIITIDEGFEIEDNTFEADEYVEENLGDDFKQHYDLSTVFDPKLELRDYRFPTLELLNEYGNTKQEIDVAGIEESKNMIIETLKNYNIGISKIKASVGPTVTLYEIIPAAGVKISKIKNLEDDIALSLAALGIRIIAPIPGKGTIGIEVPNKTPEMVPMKSVLANKKFQECDFQLPVALGKTISNEIFVTDLAKMPHLLMAGATGQGKSVGLNAILVSLLYKKHPAFIKFVLVDPKKVELTLFNKIERHFLAKLPGDGEAIITDNTKVINTLNSLCVEMDNRYKLLQEAMVRNIVEYNEKFVARKLNPEKGHRFLPYIVVVIDEVADLMMTAGKEIETPIARLAQLARAIGIHLILATQRPSVNVITGMIKANFPARIAFRVTSKIDSRTILDSNGADQLIGKGDMLFSGGNELIRLQCPFVDTPEVEKICDYIGEQRAYPYAYILPEVQDENSGERGGDFNAGEKDDLFEDAARLVVLNQVGSTSLIQRKLKIGYNRAGRLMDQLEDAGIVGPNLGSKARAVLIPDELSLEQFLNNL